MAVEPKTLNIPEKQVLVDFWEDKGDFFWHHRILLVATNAPGTWMRASPVYEVALVDFSEHRIVPLAKDEVFPVDYRGYIYSFDTADCSEARVEVMRRQARALVEIMNGGPRRPQFRKASLGVLPTQRTFLLAWRFQPPSLVRESVSSLVGRLSLSLSTRKTRTIPRGCAHDSAA